MYFDVMTTKQDGTKDYFWCVTAAKVSELYAEAKENGWDCSVMSAC